MNPYYEAEELGLEIVADVDNGGGWEFDMFLVWRDKAGHLYYAQDAGCSCPTPFEGNWGQTLSDVLKSLNRITRESLPSFETDAKDYLSADEIQNIRLEVLRES